MGDAEHPDVVDGGDGPAQQNWCHVGEDPIDHTGTQKRTSKRRAALQQYICAVGQRFDHLMRVTSANHHGSRIVVQNLCIRGNLALPHHHAQGLVRCQAAVRKAGSQLRVVDEDRACSDDDGVSGGTPAMHVGSGGFTGDPLTGSISGGAAPVDTGGEFPSHMRQSSALLVQPLPQRATADRAGQHAGRDGDTAIGEPGRATGGGRIGVRHGENDRRNLCCDKRIHTRWSPPDMVTRFQRDDRSPADRATAGPAQRQYLGVWAASR